jgi:beta-glucuronidase
VNAAPAVPAVRSGACTERVSLDGLWRFRLDPERSGEAQGWRRLQEPGEGWREVRVPHTWQIEPGSEDYYGAAWYWRSFEAPPAWPAKAVHIEFEAAFHTATVWINGRPVGRHAGKGYTAFAFEITPHLRWGSANTVVVRVENDFSDAMLPRGRSSDWTHDGGLYRPVSLLVTPPVFIERAAVDAIPEAGGERARIEAAAAVRNLTAEPWEGTLGWCIVDEETGRTVARQARAAAVRARPGESVTVNLPPAALPKPKLWHFDHPQLYRFECELETRGTLTHRYETCFGIRSIEVRDGGFYLNGEPVRLMGVERMAGSNPEFGMAEPASWIWHDHDDLKALNGVFTRVHWPQDRRVLEYCDRRGILIQLEVPAWGGRTFEGMTGAPSPEILENGLEQLREMILRDRNHPCIFAWGLANEIGGQSEPAQRFLARMLEEAKRLDPRRLCTYASNSLQQTPERDAAGQMDFVSWNEYYESWFQGGLEELRRNLEEIERAFPGKPIVISEYGYCACTPERPEEDARRIGILRRHTEIFRAHPRVAGAIFFCYNDYRTHIGDKGTGVMRQRVHGVVDLYGRRKPSFEELRRESSPIELLEASGRADLLRVTVRSRKAIPAYALRGYSVRALVYGPADIPIERHVLELPRLAPGGQATVTVTCRQAAPERVVLDVLRPTGDSAATLVWRP